MLSSSAGVKSCWPVIEVRTPTRSPALWAATLKPCATPYIKFNEEGGGLEAALAKNSSRPHTVHGAFDEERAEKLKELLHRSPREFGKPSSLWTLAMAAAEVSFKEGLSEKRVSGETIRATLARLGVRWQRAKRWITSPDPEYERKKAARPADTPLGAQRRLGVGL
jgi:hypothetical protein